jgi:LPS O-antigen subunit length determinant protein (WzzB/FepE family)
MTENSGLRFDLFDIIKVGLKWKKMIIGISISAALIAAVFFFFQKTYYKAYGHFFPASAVMSGRINLFRESNQDWIDFFGGENEVDRAYVIGNSANVVSHLIEKYKMADHYKIDVKKTIKNINSHIIKNINNKKIIKDIKNIFNKIDKIIKKK